MLANEPSYIFEVLGCLHFARSSYEKLPSALHTYDRVKSFHVHLKGLGRLPTARRHHAYEVEAWSSASSSKSQAVSCPQPGFGICFSVSNCPEQIDIPGTVIGYLLSSTIPTTGRSRRARKNLRRLLKTIVRISFFGSCEAHGQV